ncbi:MAG: peptidylprolyl isomerase [Planctomycetes bacterium]|nr:peptidylprolyl isomerase [Planctomycetota bacterium]
MNTLLASLAIALSAAAGAQEQERDSAAPPAIRIKLECDTRRLNPGAPMWVRFVIENATDQPADLDEPADYLAGLEIKDPAGRVLKSAAASKEKRRTSAVDGRGFIGRAVDLRPALAGLTYDEGPFEFVWKWAGAESNVLRPFVIRDWVATIETTHGDLTIEFYPEDAPRHVLNFLDLARNKFYDGLTFHRVIPGFVAQAARGARPPNYRLKAEFNERKHLFGTVSMARSEDPDSAATEFFICLAALESLDGRYTVFGQMIAGEPVLRDIEKVKTDHSPCARCGKALEAAYTPCCRQHHEDRPEVDVVIKKVTLAEKKPK